MTDNLPEGLQPEIGNAVRFLIEAARRKGWTVREMRMEYGVVSISAISPVSGFHFACAEDEFLDRLRGLLLKD